MNTPHLLPLAITLSAIFWTLGCQHTCHTHHTAQPVTPGNVPKPARTSTEPTGGPVQLAKVMPKHAHLGDTFEYHLVLTALDCVGNVRVTDLVPSGVTYVRSEPPAHVNGDLLTWLLNPMDSGQELKIQVWLKADKVTTLSSCATVSADPRTCAALDIGFANLTVKKAGPETAQIGSTINYDIVVVNKGTTDAHDVVVTDTVPEGLQSADGQKTLTFKVGDLAPNQPRSIPVSLKATTRGRHCNAVAVTSSNAGRAADEMCTTVLQPGLNLIKTGDQERFLGRNAGYRILLHNTGDTTLTNVVVTDMAPEAVSFVSAEGATITGNQAVWRLENLAPAQQKSFDVLLTSSTAGKHCNVATVTTGGGLQDRVEFCTLWRGIPAVLLEVTDDPDPIQVGDETTYTIRVTNQGTAELTQITVAAQFQTQMTPVSSSQGSVSGQEVRFPVVARLEPKQSFTYTVRVKGVKAGDARNRVTLTADTLTSPVVEEESSRVY